MTNYASRQQPQDTSEREGTPASPAVTAALANGSAVTGRPGGAGPKPLPDGLDLPVMNDAACKGKDPAPWFPRPGQSPEAGKALCSTCPAQARCLDWALAKGEQSGIWGGTTADERAEILRQRRRDSRHGAVA